MRVFIIWVLMGAGLCLDAGAQGVNADSLLATAQTPSQCKAVVDTLYRLANRARRADSGAAPVEAGSSAKARIANIKQCVAKFDISTISREELPALIKLYEGALMYDELAQAVSRGVELARTPKERARALSEVALALVGQDPRRDKPDIAESAVAQLDTLTGASFSDLALAHAAFAFGTYRFDDPRWKEHAEKAVSAARRIPLAERDSASPAIIRAFDYAARVRMVEGDAVGAASLSDEGHSLLSESARKYTPNVANRYRLVGTPAPAIKADYWFNAPSDAKLVDFSGKVTLLEFTTNWCVWCAKGYPAVRRIAEKYASRGLQTLFVIPIEGSAGDKSDVSLADEIGYDYMHWVVKDSIPFPIAIINAHMVVDTTTGSSQHSLPLVFGKYFVRDYPAYFIMDRKGIIRYVQMGHSWDVEERLSYLLERVLSEGTN